MPSLVHIYTVARAIEAHLKTSVIAVDSPINPELVVPQTAFYLTLLRPVKLDKRVSLITRQPKITTQDTDLYGSSLADVRAVLDFPAEVEDLEGEPGPLASLGDKDKLVFNMAPSEKKYAPPPQNQQPFEKLPKRLQEERTRIRQEKLAEDMKIYAVVEQLARSSHGEFDEILTKFRRLKPAAGPDAERVAKELALLRHRELAEAAPKPGWAFTLDEQMAGADAQSDGEALKAEDSPAHQRRGGFRLSALAEAPLAEVEGPSTEEASPVESTPPEQQPPASPSPDVKASEPSSTPSVLKPDSLSPSQTWETGDAPSSQSQPQPSASYPTVKKDDKDVQLQLARMRERRRLEEAARAEERKLLEREEKEMRRIANKNRKEREREQEEADKQGVFRRLGRMFGSR